MYAKFFLFLIFFLNAKFLIASLTGERIVREIVGLGEVAGFQLPIVDSATGDEAYANIFLGIPYAKPPVGVRRFERPVEPDNWQGVRDAGEFAPACLQMSRATMPNEADFSEDCLYLNIMTPSKDATGLPVLFYIHGGGFRYGSAVKWGYKFLAENYVSRNIVVVTIQYRLGLFGFSTAGQKSFDANIGLWDVHAALKFVTRHIGDFGGDANRITLWGHSSGSTFVGLLTISPHTANLFSQAIHMSGSPLGEWACSYRVANETKKLADSLNCSFSERLKECMKSKSTSELIDGAEKCAQRPDVIMSLQFTVSCADDEFHKAAGLNGFTNAIKTAPPKPTLLGFTPNEATFHTLLEFKTAGNEFGIPREEFEKFDETKFKKYVKKILTFDKNFGANLDELVERICKFYLNDRFLDANQLRDNKFYLKQHAEFVSDYKFVVPLFAEAKLKLRNGWPVYMYQFAYANMRRYPEWIPVKCVPHCAELLYALGPSLSPREAFSDEEKRVNDFFVSSVANFVHFGDPSSAQLKWPSLTPTNTSVHVRIDEEARVVNSRPEVEFALQFWAQAAAQLGVTTIHDVQQFAGNGKNEAAARQWNDEF